ncbi:CDC50 family protein chat-1-like [Schistocerca piceifrons]|uniref:CDC50 family protein chat-1-like n=1 Tax=Schistocerca piceifrons TaxID=274613 RepID=UPI001F5F201E|nr:CDC50 family protein chat-1-like [Schistocerca piceifrons]
MAHDLTEASRGLVSNNCNQEDGGVAVSQRWESVVDVPGCPAEHSLPNPETAAPRNGSPPPLLLQNEDLIVWMRTSALPKFRKLYRRVDHSREPFADGLPAGNYTLYVEYNYPVASFSGSKVFIVTSTTVVGAGNQFLGAAYVTCGCVCMLLGAMFVALHLRYRQAAAFMVTVERETPYL